MPNHRALAAQARDEAARLIRMVAANGTPNEKVKVSIQRAATRLSWPYRRTEDIWRREARRIDSWEMDMLRKCAIHYRRKRQ